MSDNQIDEVTGVSTTGHEWDGIRELNNPLPRWWLWTFYFTIFWALAYTIAYPAWPLVHSATRGVLGYSSRGELNASMQDAAAAQASLVKAIAGEPVSAIVANDDLRRFATAAGSAVFKINCVQCHGSGAQGSAGYPNLNDDDWLWGGSVDQIYQTISHGIRYEADPDTRVSQMPAFGEMLKPSQVDAVAAFVASLSGPVSNPEAVSAGARVFAQNCAACHGSDGKGNKDVGAPNLADAIWLYHSGEAAIAAQVSNPRHGVMPAWKARLGDIKVKELAVFVHSLGGGK